MRVFVFESLSAGPLDVDSADASPEASLLIEGQAMLAALASDLADVEDVEVCTLIDGRFAARFAGAAFQAVSTTNATDRGDLFDRFATTCDATIVIAPEIGGELAELCRRVERSGGRLLGPAVDAIELLGDKHRTAEYLQHRGVPVCRGIRLDPGPLNRTRLAEFAFPAVVKPLDGAGSLGVRLVRAFDELSASDFPRRLEQFAAGMAASVAVLCGPNGRCMLPACAQRIGGDGRFAYRGGATPLEAELDRRARALAERAVAAMPGLLGYVGVDLILGFDPTGSDDVVVEINPRLTTSYVGLRRLAETNLAATLLDVAAGRFIAAPTFRPGKVEFDADGETRYIAQPLSRISLHHRELGGHEEEK
ncbi:MAG: ATP-grasp domain-containing protein [Pirellulales bacterium]